MRAQNAFSFCLPRHLLNTAEGKGRRTANRGLVIKSSKDELRQ